MFRFIIFTLLFLLSNIGHSLAFSIATWNVAEGTTEAVLERSDDFKQLAAKLRNDLGGLPDVLVLQEITTCAAAVTIPEKLGYKLPHIAVTNFGDDSKIWPLALEVAIISKTPFSSVGSFQSQRYRRSKPIAPQRPFWIKPGIRNVVYGGAAIAVVPKIKFIDHEVTAARGFLNVQIANQRHVIGVHLKSSGLEVCRAYQVVQDSYRLLRLAKSYGLKKTASDLERIQGEVRDFQKNLPPLGNSATANEARQSARQREVAAASVSRLAKSLLTNGGSVYVAGDFNTPLDEPCKTGTDLENDADFEVGCKIRVTANTCKGDGFDDTIALLSGSIGGGPKFKILTNSTGRSYVATKFLDSPINNIFVSGADASKDFMTKRVEGKIINKRKVFGSDHYPIISRIAK